MRLVLYVSATVVVYQVASWLPLVGVLVRSVPILGILGAMMATAALGRWLERSTRERRRAAAELRDLGAVQTPNARGKLGSALLARGKASQALEPLGIAREGEPASREWAYRLSQALAATGDLDGARRELEATVAMDEEYAYGSAMLELSGLRLELSDAEGALEAARRAERNHGPSPESSCRAGLALKALGRGVEARAAFDEAVELAASVPAFRRGDARRWAGKARRARISGR